MRLKKIWTDSHNVYKEFEFYKWPVVKRDSLTKGKVLMSETLAFEHCSSEDTVNMGGFVYLSHILSIVSQLHVRSVAYLENSNAIHSIHFVYGCYLFSHFNTSII